MERYSHLSGYLIKEFLLKVFSIKPLQATEPAFQQTGLHPTKNKNSNKT